MKLVKTALLLICLIFTHGVYAETGGLELTEQEVQSLSILSDSTKIYFFFRGDCGYCHKLAPGLKAFAKKYHFTVVPVSLDGGGLPEYPHPQADDGAADSWQVSGVPAVYAVNFETRNVYPVAYGMISIQQLANRLLMIKQ